MIFSKTILRRILIVIAVAWALFVFVSYFYLNLKILVPKALIIMNRMF